MCFNNDFHKILFIHPSCICVHLLFVRDWVDVSMIINAEFIVNFFRFIFFEMKKTLTCTLAVFISFTDETKQSTLCAFNL